LQLYADGGYQLRIRSLEGTPNYGLRQMGLEKIVKDFDLFGIETNPIPPNPYGLRAKQTSPKREFSKARLWFDGSPRELL
jgi:hypothetical protein